MQTAQYIGPFCGPSVCLVHSLAPSNGRTYHHSFSPPYILINLLISCQRSLVGDCWHCSHSMRQGLSNCTVYVRLSVPFIDRCTIGCGGFAVRPATGDIDWVLHGWLSAETASSATLSADVGRWTQSVLYGHNCTVSRKKVKQNIPFAIGLSTSLWTLIYRVSCLCSLGRQVQRDCISSLLYSLADPVGVDGTVRTYVAGCSLCWRNISVVIDWSAGQMCRRIVIYQLSWLICCRASLPKPKSPTFNSSTAELTNYGCAVLYGFVRISYKTKMLTLICFNLLLFIYLFI